MEHQLSNDQIKQDRIADDREDGQIQHKTDRRPLIILAGPTAVGKTKASIGLAKAIGGEIVSADSMQVYRHMDIGSAKITKEEMEGVPHHLIDCLDPEEPFHVAKFQEMAREAIQKIYEKGHIPILTGGTGFYIQAVLYDIDFTEEKGDDGIRKELEEFARLHGPEALHRELEKVDRKAAEAIHANNVRRVVRALEYFRLTGEQISVHNERERQKTSPYQFAFFVLNDEREHLYERIDRRVDQMMEEGLLEEVIRLKEAGYSRDLVSMQGLGYKELLSYLDGEITLEEAVRIIKRDTRHFAKRQITWFKREPDVIWINKQTYHYEEDAVLAEMLDCLKEKEIL